LPQLARRSCQDTEEVCIGLVLDVATQGAQDLGRVDRVGFPIEQVKVLDYRLNESCGGCHDLGVDFDCPRAVVGSAFVRKLACEFFDRHCAVLRRVRHTPSHKAPWPRAALYPTHSPSLIATAHPHRATAHEWRVTTPHAV